MNVRATPPFEMPSFSYAQCTASLRLAERALRGLSAIAARLPDNRLAVRIMAHEFALADLLADTEAAMRAAMLDEPAPNPRDVAPGCAAAAAPAPSRLAPEIAPAGLRGRSTAAPAAWDGHENVYPIPEG